MSKFERVAVLLGGDSPEREISLLSGKAIANALAPYCAELIEFDPSQNSLIELAKLKPQHVFIALHGGSGEDGHIQAALEMLKISYTGSNAAACVLAMDKRAALAIWHRAALPCGDWQVVDASTDQAQLKQIANQLNYPLFIKPNKGGSSIASGSASNFNELLSRVTQALVSDKLVLIEPLFQGLELTYGIIGNQVLPGIQIEQTEEFYDYAAKYQSETTKFICPPSHSATNEQQYQQIAKQAFELIGCSGWGRVDLLVQDDNCKLLEVNTVPGMTSHSLVPAAAKQIGIDFSNLAVKILEEAQ